MCGVTVRGVVWSWGNVLSISVLLFDNVVLFHQVALENSSLLVKSLGKCLCQILQFVIEGFVQFVDTMIKCSFGIDFCLGKSFSQSLAGLIEKSSLVFTEVGKCVLLSLKSLTEVVSGLSNCFGDSSSFGFKEFNQVELVVRVVDVLDLLEFSLLCGIKCTLFLNKCVFEGGSLGSDGLDESIIVVIESVVECSCISNETVMEGSSLGVE